MAASIKACRFLSFNKLSSCNSIFVRHGRVRLHRKPIRIISESDPSVEEKEKVKEMKDYVKARKKQARMKQTPDLSEMMTKKRRPFKLPPDVTYTRLEEGDRRFGPLVMAAKSRKHRYKENIIFLEGKRLILDAIYSGQELKCIFFDHLDTLEGLPFKEFTTDLYRVSPSHMRIWSDVATPQGIMALMSIPESVECELENRVPVTLILDNIRDPGNMGTLLRTAAAVGCQKVLAMKGCVDVWEPKVLRSATGSHFRVSLVPHVTWEEVGGHLPSDTCVALADNNLSDEIDATTNTKAMQQLMADVTSIEPNSYTEVDEKTGKVRHIDETFSDQQILSLFESVPLELTSLFDSDWSEESHVTVVVGGEVWGVGAEAKKLTFERGGERVFVPMVGGVESLNAAVAGSVLLFEIKRQMAAGRVRKEDG